MRRAALTLVAALGCVHGRGASGREPDGVAIAIHVDRRDGASSAVVIDRRTIAIDADGAVALTDLLGEIDLETVTLEAIDGGGAIALAGCVRAVTAARLTVGRTVELHDGGRAPVAGVLDRVDGDAVIVADGAEARRVPIDALGYVRVPVAQSDGLRCQLERGRGRRRVRVTYRSPSFSWTPTYRVRTRAGDEQVEVATSFAITAPPRPTPGPVQVTLVAGVPDDGTGAAPLVVWTGALALDGAIQVFGESVGRPAWLGWVYRGAVATDLDDGGLYDSRTEVIEGLELEPRPSDVPGPVVVERDGQAPVVVALPPTPPLDDQPRRLWLPLSTSTELVGYRRWRYLTNVGAGPVHELLYSVANHGDVPRRVRIEEPLAGRRPTLRHALPEGEGEFTTDRWQRVVTVAPGAIARGALVIQYGAER